MGGGSDSGGGSSGGAMTSGKIDFPLYLKKLHKTYMYGGSVAPHNVPTVSMGEEIDVVWNNSPFVDAVAYDPSTLVTASQTSVDNYKTVVDALDDDADWISFVKTGAQFVDGYIISEDAIAASVEEFSRQQLKDLAPGRIRIAAGFADVNAVHASNFPGAMILLEDAHRDKVREYEANLRRDREIARSASIERAVDSMSRFLMHRTGTQQNLSSLQVDTNRLAIDMHRTKTNRDIDLEAKDTLWNIQMLQYGLNALSAIGGGTAVYKTAPGEDNGSSSGGLAMGLVSLATAAIGIGSLFGGK